MKRDITGEILDYHRMRWSQEYQDSEMAVSFGRDKRKIKEILALAKGDDMYVKRGIDELFRMKKDGTLGANPPDVLRLRGWWNKVVDRLQKREYDELEESF